MTSSGTIEDADWGKLASMEENERTRLMLGRYNELLGLSPEERHARLKAIATIEYSLPDPELRALTIGRMRCLLSMEEEAARSFIQSYDAVMREMPANAAMRRVGMVQTVAAEFTAEEEERLRALIPTIFAGAPRRTTGLDTSGPPLAVERPAAKRPWWAFWKKG